ncbi:MAG: tetratricopeptide repeat protein [Arcobacter sp.]|nr:tetratricopeptide repeat protein [Arcobacter sp.]
MDNIKNIKVLAETALESNNYEEAYNYFTKLLENDPSNYSFWYGKGISAGNCSTVENPKFDELIVCLKHALKNDTQNELDKLSLVKTIHNICIVKLEKTLSTIDKKVTNEFDQKQMGTGELHTVHQTKKLAIQLRIGNKYSPLLIKIIDTMEFGCEINSSSDSYIKIIDGIDKIFQHSLDNVEYFKNHKESGSRFEEMLIRRNHLIQKAKEKDLNFIPNSQPQSNSTGCFIATAVLGDYKHPYILTFHKYRNEVLKKELFGRFFINFYYNISPPIAKLISKSSFSRKILLKILIKPIYLKLSKMYKN